PVGEQLALEDRDGGRRLAPLALGNRDLGVVVSPSPGVIAVLPVVTDVAHIDGAERATIGDVPACRLGRRDSRQQRKASNCHQLDTKFHWLSFLLADAHVAIESAKSEASASMARFSWSATGLTGPSKRARCSTDILI